jgi:hypothetical protein
MTLFKTALQVNLSDIFKYINVDTEKWKTVTYTTWNLLQLGPVFTKLVFTANKIGIKCVSTKYFMLFYRSAP